MVYEPITDGREAYTTKDTIVLNPDVYPPRLNYAFCHELAHLLLKHPYEPYLRKEIEREADTLAIELMLPREEFIQAMKLYTIPELKRLHPHASWEVIARRWGEFQPAVVTIFDEGLLTRRIPPPGMICPLQPTPEEWDLVRLTFSTKTHQRRTSNLLIMHSYYIDEARGVQRVILITEPRA